MGTTLDSRQSLLRAALGMVGSAANDTLDTIFPKIDAELAKHFEDRNILLSDGGTLTFTGTLLQFTENLNLTLNQKISGAVPQVISLGQASQTFINSGDMMIAVIDRTAGTSTVSIVTNGSALPAANSANQEVFLIAKRLDAGDGTQRIYLRNGQALSAGQSVRIGASGSGSGGSGTGDDLDALTFRASFTDTFTEAATNANSSINSSSTNATFSAAKAIYTMNYDASKTVTGTGTSMTLSATPAYTVVAGDVLVVGGVVRKITTVTSQTVYVIEAAFPTSPTAAQATVSQAVYSKDVYNLAVDGSSIASAFGSSTFSEILVIYKDNATAGSSVFTPNTTPLVAFVASPDNATFTTTQLRATNETDTAQSTILSSAGTSLYLRFYSNKISGSGFVNLINYKAFLQKSTASAAGGVINAAYAFTNGTGTAVNCATSVVGGKTTVTLTFQYAVGVLPGTSASSIKVYLNGQKLPRFLNATTTPDGSFIEASSTVIQLDRDYSAQQLSVEVVQDVAVIDSSTQNTTAIAAIQGSAASGFQGFIDQTNVITATSTAGTPVAGTFYSTISNRANLIDFGQDLKPRMGIERIAVQSIVQLQNEFGPNGEAVWAALNDINGQSRYVGAWTVDLSTLDGSRLSSGANTTDYVEVTFYGTGLNLLSTRTGGRNIAWSVDGGSETTVSNYDGTSLVINSRNYAANNVNAIVSGLSLGIHTVKVRSNNSAALQLTGFEILNESTSLKIQPGTSYLAGAKLVSSAQTVTPYNSTFDSGTLGSVGGHVVVYQKSDGTIGKAVTPAGTPLFLTSATHANEEIVRNYYYREFGAGRTDDFSGNYAGGANLAFTLDDGSTTLITSGASPSTTQTARDSIAFNAVNNFLTFTFVGTGLDVVITGSDSGTYASNYSVIIDGTTIAASVSASTLFGRAIRNGLKTIKIASGLPYGTHTFKILITTFGLGEYLSNFIIYQPKKPSLPTGAVELADYNVMATPVANTVAGIDTVTTGVLRKLITREFTYVGTWTLAVQSAGAGGFDVTSGITNSYIQYSFFGTGFDFRYQANTDGAIVQASLNGTNLTAANFPSATFGQYGTGSFASATGLLTQTGASTPGSGLVITGLPLGLYTLKLNNTNTGNFRASTIDIITPIHSTKSNLVADLQNTLAVGSCALSDNRKFTAVKDVLPGNKAWVQAFTTGSLSTSSTSIVPMPGMSCTVKTSGSPIQISYSVQVTNSTSGAQSYFQIAVDGVLQNNKYVTFTASYSMIVSDTAIIPVSAGTHKVDIYWNAALGTTNSSGGYSNMSVREV